MISFLRQKKVYIPLGIIILGAVCIGFYYVTHKRSYQTVKVEAIQFIQEVSVTGKVVAASDVNLSFQTGGKVSDIPVLVGQQVTKGATLAYVSSPDLYASLLSRKAQLDIERSRLAALVRGARPEELSIAETNLEQSNISLKASIADAYTKADDALVGKTDILFINPRSASPEFLSFNDFPRKKSIESQRINFTTILNNWRQYDDTYLFEARNNLYKLSDYLKDLSIAVASLDTKDNNLPQSTIDQYKSNVSVSRANINAAIVSLNASEQAFKSATDQLALKKAGNSSEDITAQEASVRSAETNILQIQAQIGNTVIIAPFTGTITKINLKVGQLIAPSSLAISMIGDARFEIESYIPEADISKIGIGFTGTTTLDAYGDSAPFQVVVTAIDLSETIVEGVTTYKTTLQFVDTDDRIRSGMTANIDLKSATRQGILSVPQTAIISTKGIRTVLVLDPKNNTQSRVVTTGSIDNAGHIEIKNGLEAGETVVTNPSK